MARRKRPDEDEYGRHFVPKPAEHPNETLRCRWCGTDTEHTVSDFCGKKVKLCCECGEMRSVRWDVEPRVHRHERAKPDARPEPAECSKPEPLPEPAAEPETAYEPHEVVPEFGLWRTAKHCRACGHRTTHDRSLWKVRGVWVYRCGDCGRVASAGVA